MLTDMFLVQKKKRKRAKIYLTFLQKTTFFKQTVKHASLNYFPI